MVESKLIHFSLKKSLSSVERQEGNNLMLERIHWMYYVSVIETTTLEWMWVSTLGHSKVYIKRDKYNLTNYLSGILKNTSRIKKNFQFRFSFFFNFVCFFSRKTEKSKIKEVKSLWTNVNLRLKIYSIDLTNPW